MSETEVLPIIAYADVKEKIGNGKPLIIAFGMRHCYSCLTMSKLFAQVLKEHPEYQIYSVDGQRERHIIRDIYRFKSMPTQIFFDAEGNELFRHHGAYKKAVPDIIMKKYGFCGNS
jgi:thioredoxin 1